MRDGALRIILAADSAAVRRAVLDTVQRVPEWALVRAVTADEDLGAAVRLDGPDVLLVAIGGGEGHGLEVVRQLRADVPKLRILALVERGDVLDAVLAAGADGCLLWEDVAAELQRALRADAGLHFSPCLHHAVINGFLRSRPSSVLDLLQPDERDLLQLLAEGRRTKEAARIIGLSEGEATEVEGALMCKIGARSTAELIRFARRHGIVSPQG